MSKEGLKAAEAHYTSIDDTNMEKHNGNRNIQDLVCLIFQEKYELQQNP